MAVGSNVWPLVNPGNPFCHSAGRRVGAIASDVDLRIAKVLRFGRTRTHVGVDIFNVVNAAPVVTYNQVFVPNGQWLTPLSVLTPRL